MVLCEKKYEIKKILKIKKKLTRKENLTRAGMINSSFFLRCLRHLRVGNYTNAIVLVNLHFETEIAVRFVQMFALYCLLYEGCFIRNKPENGRGKY